VDIISSCRVIQSGLKPCPVSTLSQKSATVTENGETTATVAEFGDSRTFLRQCGHWTGLYVRYTLHTMHRAKATQCNESELMCLLKCMC